MKMVLDIVLKTGLEALRLFREMAPYILLGALLSGLLHILIRKEWIVRYAGRGWRSVWIAALFGVPLPLCSCGVIPAARYLKKAGASSAAVTSFLISTPQTGADSLIATAGLMGPFLAVYRALAAFLSGIVGGTAAFLTGGSRGDSPKPGEEQTASDKKRTIGARLAEMFRYAFGETMEDLALPLVAGLLVAALIGVLVPADFLAGTPFSKGLPGILLMGLLGLPLYVCSTSSIPVALVLISKGISPGAAFVFLMTGPATNAASLTVLFRTLGAKQTLIYILSIFVTAGAGGLLLDFLWPVIPAAWRGLAPVTGEGESLAILAVEIALSAFLAALLGWQLILKLRTKQKAATPEACAGTCSCQVRADTSE